MTARPMDAARIAATKQLDPSKRSALGQFMTPSVIADFMASLFRHWPERVRLVDPGAGIGSLTEAFSNQFLKHAPSGASLEAHCFEIEPLLIGYLGEHLAAIEKQLKQKKHGFISTIHDRDFIAEASYLIGMNGPRFTHAILNPPYKKINTDSDHRRTLRTVGIETVNLYTAFLALVVAMTEQGGEVVAIIPRSFCNGTYYRPFRHFMLERCAIKQIHVFESRTNAFKDDEVLQENIIIHLQRGATQGDVMVSTSHDPTFSDYQERAYSFAEIVKPNDAESFIHVPTLDINGDSKLFTHTLKDLGLSVSTGPVVDFRMMDYWQAEPKGKHAPLLYAHHFKDGAFTWPREHKKPNALRLADDVEKWLMPKGFYAITKRFSAKEERRRLVAYVVNPADLPHEKYGFENHLNVFHSGKKGISEELARGLALFLNCTVADQYFRNFSGHTQVNAGDLKAMLYPSLATLETFGKWARKQKNLSQEKIDKFVEGHDGEQ